MLHLYLHMCPVNKASGIREIAYRCTIRLKANKYTKDGSGQSSIFTYIAWGYQILEMYIQEGTNTKPKFYELFIHFRDLYRSEHQLEHYSTLQKLLHNYYLKPTYIWRDVYPIYHVFFFVYGVG